MVQRPETHLAGDLASTPAAQKEYELLKILAEHYFGSMLVTDDRGRFLYVSDGTCRLLGVDRETLLQLSIYDTLKATALPPALLPSRRWKQSRSVSATTR